MAKLNAFGWDTHDIDGHDPDAISAVLDGFGARRSAAGDCRPHGQRLGRRGPSEGQLARQATAGPTRSTRPWPRSIRLWRPIPTRRSSARRPSRLPPFRLSESIRTRSSGRRWADAFKEAGFGAALEKGRLGTRKAYGAALRTAGALLPQLVVLDGDVSNSTFTELFAKAHPERFVECKIAEQNMISVAAGLSAAGYNPRRQFVREVPHTGMRSG